MNKSVIIPAHLVKPNLGVWILIALSVLLVANSCISKQKYIAVQQNASQTLFIKATQETTSAPTPFHETTTSPFSNWDDNQLVPDKGFAIKISKFYHKMRLYNNGSILKEFSVSTGFNEGDKQQVGDKRTPEGRFRILSIVDASNWRHDFEDDTFGELEYAYGPFFIRLETNKSDTFNQTGTWKGIGIHGTCDQDYPNQSNAYTICGPSSIGYNVSEGCIRMFNEDLQTLVALIKANPLHIPVFIVDGIMNR